MTNFRPRWMTIAAAFVAAFGSVVAAGESVASAPSATIAVDSVWSRPAVGTAVAYATIRNRSSESDRLLGATSPAAVRIGIHESSTTHDRGPAMSMGGIPMPSGNAMMSMKTVDAITIPANGLVRLEPGGYHLMLALRRPISAGETIPLRLHFARAGWIAVSSSVRLEAASDASPIEGAFALQTGAARTHGFLRVTSRGRNALHEHFDFWMTRHDDTRPIAHYDIDMTKLLHLVVIGDDFSFFDHVHPVLASDGHFTIDETLPSATGFEVYADASPTGIGQQVFRFALSASASAHEAKALSPSGRVASAGPYTVELSTTHVGTGRATDITAHVRRDGKPATDLHPYLGALAHVVIVSSADLSYVHVHPMALSGGAMGAMGSMADMPALPDTETSPSEMSLHVELREAGTYKVWFQFRAGSQIYVAPFVIDAS